jgi:hypothetical protein
MERSLLVYRSLQATAREHAFLSFGCKCELKPNEPAMFENPSNNQPIRTSGLAYARFWIEFGIGDWVWGTSTPDKVSIRVSRASATASVFFVFGKPPDLCEAIACLESSVERHRSPDLRPVVVFNTDKPFTARTPLDTKPD